MTRTRLEPNCSIEPWTEPTVVITFDDGFRSVYENAWPQQVSVSRPAKNGQPRATAIVNFKEMAMTGDMRQNYLLEENDIIYIPRETPLIEAARQRGNRTVTGLGMLLHQGIPAWKAWFGIEPKVTAELRAKAWQAGCSRGHSKGVR